MSRDPNGQQSAVTDFGWTLIGLFLAGLVTVGISAIGLGPAIIAPWL